MLRFLTAGESHGKGLVVIVEGMPAGVSIALEYIKAEMIKRMKGAGSGGRMLIESDDIELMSGVRFGQTIGSPIGMIIRNKDAKNWGEKMSAEPQDEAFIESIKVTQPRPGHADLTGVLKYGFDDVRNVLERASARETAARVAAGAIFKQYLLQCNIHIASHTLQIGDIRVESEYSFDDIRRTYDKDPEIRCVDRDISNKMKAAIDTARREMNTLGGVVETWATNVPVGLGSYVHWDRKIDGQIAQALMSIPSVKAVEIGEGVAVSGAHGSEVHDEIYYSEEKGYYRKTNNAGGVEGGMTNGMPLVVRAYHKPISTLYKPLKTVDIKSKHPVDATVERSDICVVPRGGVVSEAMLAYVIAKNMIERHGNEKI